MSLTEWFDTLLSALPVIALALAILTGHAAAKINRKNKIADVVMHCMSRYDAIAHDKAKISSHDEALYYFRRYWGLKSDQFDYWLSGLVDAENILSWFYSILSAFQNDKVVTYSREGVSEQISFAAGWDMVRESHVAQDTTFVRTVEHIRQIARESGQPKEKYDRLVELFIEIEADEKYFIRFTEVNFIFMRIRGGNMKSFKKMEHKTKKRRQENSGLRLSTLD